MGHSLRNNGMHVSNDLIIRGDTGDGGGGGEVVVMVLSGDQWKWKW